MDVFKSFLPEGKTVHCLEDLGSLTVAKLKVILKQYKEKKSGNKADLILRTFAVFCRAKNYEKQSGEVPEEVNESMLYCHEKEYTYEAAREQCIHLPWSSDLRGTPSFSFIQLYEYLVIRTSKYKHILLKSTAYKKLKAFQFFQEGFIRKIDVAKDDDFTFFDVRVKASMKAKLYKVIVKLSNKSGDVCSAACSCPAGIGLHGFGNCNHVGGVLFALEDFNRHGLQEYPSAVSCTSKLSSWNVPNASALKSFTAVPINELVIRKIKFGKENAGIPSFKSFDPRAPCDKVVNSERLELFKSQMAEFIPNSGFFGFHQHSSLPLPQDSDLPTPSDAVSVATDSGDLSLNEFVSFNESYDISSPSFKEMMNIYCNNLALSAEEIIGIEQATRGQSENENWMKHRLYRITASNFYSAAVNSVEPSSKLKSMYYKSFSSAATSHGKKFESHVRELYTILLKENGFTAQISDVGLHLSSSFPYLGASLDGIVSCQNEKWGLEIKCPFSKYNCSLQHALTDKKFFLFKDDHGTIKLKRKHSYFFQIQGQMFCANLKRVDFVVWFGSDEPLFVETIWYDKDFVMDYMIPRLRYFYCSAVLPELFTKRVKKGLKLYLHDGWENFDRK